MGSSASLLVAVLFGAFGMGYFVYGKKQGRAMPLLCGVALCVFPYFVDNVWVSCVIGVVLLALPFLIDF